MHNSKFGELSKNTILFAIGSFGSKLITFFLVPLYTYALTTSEYGTIDMISTTITLLVPLLSLNVQDAVLRFSLEKDRNSADVFNIAVKIVCVGDIVLGLLLLFLSATNIISTEKKFLFYLWISFLLQAVLNIVQTFLKTEDKTNVIVFSSVCSTALCCICNILLLVVIKLGINGFLISSVFSSLLGLIICFAKGNLLKYLQFRNFDKKTLIEMVTFSAPLILNSLAWWINTGSDKYVITFFFGKSLEGIYAVSGKIPNILSVLQTVFYNAWSISAIKEFDKKDSDGFVGNTYLFYSGMSVTACSVLLLINPFIGKFLYQKEFIEAVKYIPALLLGIVFNGLSLFEGCLFVAEKKTKAVSVSTIIGAFINTLLNFILIPRFGAQGAAIATMIGYSVVWMIRSILLKSIIKLKFNWLIHLISIALLLFQTATAVCEISLSIQIIIAATIIVIQLLLIIPKIKSIRHLSHV